MFNATDSWESNRLSNEERLKRGRAAVAKHYKKYRLLTAAAATKLPF